MDQYPNPSFYAQKQEKKFHETRKVAKVLKKRDEQYRPA
jgi:hypothetical protein